MRVAAGGRGVEVGRAPHAAVDVLAAVDRDRREQPRHRAGRSDRLGDGRGRGAGTAEHDPATVPAVNGRDPQAAVEPGLEALDRSAQPGERVGRAGQPAEHRCSHDRAARRGHSERHRRERRADGERPVAGAAGGGEPGGGQAVRGAGRGAQLKVAADRGRAARRLAGDQVRGDDRPGRGPDVVVAVAQVEAGAVLDPGQDAHHPGLAEDPTAAEDEHVGSRTHDASG